MRHVLEAGRRQHHATRQARGGQDVGQRVEVLQLPDHAGPEERAGQHPPVGGPSLQLGVVGIVCLVGSRRHRARGPLSEDGEGRSCRVDLLE